MKGSEGEGRRGGEVRARLATTFEGGKRLRSSAVEKIPKIVCC